MNISALISEGEGQRVEFKQSSSADNQIIDSLGAFANSEGGAVLVGVRDDGAVVGAHVGVNTLENFSNKLAARSDPSLQVSIDVVDLPDGKVVAFSVQRAAVGVVYYTFGTPKVRSGKTNQTMSPQEQRARLVVGQQVWHEESERPRFELFGGWVSNSQSEFGLYRYIRQVEGEYITAVQWRYRGPRLRPEMQWHQTSASAFRRYTLSGKFDKCLPIGDDDLLSADQIGVEVRFHWRGKWRSEVHRYQLNGWEVGPQVLPPLYVDE